MANNIFGRGVLVVGAGFLGGEIVTQLKPICDRVIYTHRNCQPLEDGCEPFDFFRDDVFEIFKKHDIGTVILVAKIEFHEDANILADAMKRFAESCNDKRLIYLSSDGIFDGRQASCPEDYRYHSGTRYGTNLDICERLVSRYAPNHCIIRPSYIYGHSNGKLDSRLSKVAQEINIGGKVERFIDMFKSPLHVCQVAKAVIQLALSDYIGVVHVAGERMSVYDLTREALEALGMPTDKLVGIQMPKDCTGKFLPDTSLDFQLMEKLIGLKPLGVKESFVAFPAG